MKPKNNISEQTSENDFLSPLPESAKTEANGYKVPDGYFDSLGSRITDRIILEENKAFKKSQIPVFRKPALWAPLLATSIVAVLLVFVIPAKKTATIPATDEWNEINMAYDASYAQEVLFTESNSMDFELENAVISLSESNTSKGINEITDDEITDYLKDQELDLDMLTYK